MPAAAPDPLITTFSRLTKSHVEGVSLPGARRIHYATHDALLKQLRDAVGGDIDRAGGAGSKLANEKTPIDPDALEKYLALVVRVQDFYLAWVGERPPVDQQPEVTLARGFREYRNAVARGLVQEHIQKATLSMFEAWCLVVEEKLDPPTQRELFGAECPECGLSSYTVVTNKDRTTKDRSKAWFEKEHHASTLTVVYRPDGLGGLSKCYVRCGCCETAWMGDQGLRHVSFEINAPDLITEVAAVITAADEIAIAGEVPPRQALALAERARDVQHPAPKPGPPPVKELG